jgi:hypothetical protein
MQLNNVSLLSDAVARVQAVRNGTDDVFDACAAGDVVGKGARIAARLRAVGSDIDALEAAWPQLEALMQAAGDAADRDEPPAAQPAAPSPATALRDRAAAVLSDLQLAPPPKRPRLSGERTRAHARLAA